MTPEMEALAERIDRLMPQVEEDGWLTICRLMRRFIELAREQKS